MSHSSLVVNAGDGQIALMFRQVFSPPDIKRGHDYFFK